MNPYNENNLVEQTVIKQLQEMWGQDCFVNAFSDEEDAKLGRENRGEVVLKKFLLEAIKKINKNLVDVLGVEGAAEAIASAVLEIGRSRAHLPLVVANQEVYKLLRDGVTVQKRLESGNVESMVVKIFDFENVENNDFKLVSQMWITGQIYTKRPDLIVFVNGIPLLNIELKSAEKNLKDALTENINPYKESIPQLYWYNMGLLISNGVENKFGSITSSFEFFNDWKKVESEDDESKSDITTIIKGICDKKRLLDILENFVLFDEGKKLRKIVPRYFQYYGVNRAFKNTENRENLHGRLGVFWHTQGSGKSYSMVFLSQKVMRKLSGNFTFVVVTDRSDLDRQTYENFSRVGSVYEAEVKAESISHLKELLSQDHRQIFTTIQKFQDITSAISSRKDIIVMTDEAHRSQYSQMALNMRKAIPNASFIGFTGTPLLADGDESTRETFGDYVSKYNFSDSIQDKATVPLFYENRILKLNNVNENFEEQLAQVINRFDLNGDEEEKLQSEFSSFYHIITREDRLDAVARDIVEHYAKRGYDGKAMVVSIDKTTAVRMYVKVQKEWEIYIKKLELQMQKENDDYKREKIRAEIEKCQDVEMAVVVSQSGDEIEKLAKYNIDMAALRAKMNEKTGDGKTSKLETEFKNVNSNLKMVFVCSMWLTGFDVPNISTLYLDKPLKNHTLMQTIARANRVSEGKQNGLIVDYIGIFKKLQLALALYASTNKGEAVIREKSEIENSLKEKITEMLIFLKNKEIEVEVLEEVDNQEKINLIETYVNILLENKEDKKYFLSQSSEIYQTYLSFLPDQNAEKYYVLLAALKVLAQRIRNVGKKSVDVSVVQKEMEELLDKSIQVGQYTIPHYSNLKDLSKLDANKLYDFFFGLENKEVQAEMLEAELKDKIEQMVQINKKRLKFIEKLNKLIQKYNSETHDIDGFLKDLMGLGNELSEEEKRGAKENLTEEELTVFDLLYKENLDPDEIEQIKKVAKSMLEKLKSEKLTPEWREFEQTRAGVRAVISEYVFELPDPKYSEEECKSLAYPIYNHIYEYYKS